MPLDVIDVDGVADSRPLIEIEHVTLQVCIIDDATKIAFEMAVIHHVETDQRTEQPPIGFKDAISEQVAAGR